MPVSLHVSAATCTNFIDIYLEAAENEKMIFQNNEKFDTCKFREIHIEGGSSDDGISFETWADYLQLLEWCFFDISIKDAQFISKIWVKYISSLL